MGYTENLWTEIEVLAAQGMPEDCNPVETFALALMWLKDKFEARLTALESHQAVLQGQGTTPMETMSVPSSVPPSTPGTATVGPCPSCGASLGGMQGRSVRSITTDNFCTLWVCSKCLTEVSIPIRIPGRLMPSGSSGSEVSEPAPGPIVLDNGRGRCAGPEPVADGPDVCVHGFTAAHDWPKAGRT